LQYPKSAFYFIFFGSKKTYKITFFHKAKIILIVAIHKIMHSQPKIHNFSRKKNLNIANLLKIGYNKEKKWDLKII